MKSGFTLMEAVITLAIVAIVGAIMIPLISNNIRSARFARAGSDVTTIGKAIVQFRQNLALWPVNEGAAPRRLLFGDSDATNDGIPDNSSIPENWATDVGQAERLSLEYHLINNTNGYTEGPSPDGTPAWNGPYLGQINLDPWGNPYVVNSEWLYNPGGSGVYVLSAGEGASPVIDTPFGGSPPAGSNDITFRIQ